MLWSHKGVSISFTVEHNGDSSSRLRSYNDNEEYEGDKRMRYKPLAPNTK